MAISTRELLESENIVEVRGSQRGEKRFKVWNVDANNAPVPIDAATVRSAPGVPNIGDGFSASIPALKCQEIAFNHLVGQHMYEVVARYQSPPTYQRPMIQAFIEPQRVWRAFRIHQAARVANEFIDIGGTGIDENGKPVEGNAWRLKFTLPSLLQSDNIDNLLGGFGYQITGKLNTAAFHGLPPGTVRYLGAHSQPIEPDGSLVPAQLGYNIVLHDFMYDANFFYEQQPKIFQTGYTPMTYIIGNDRFQATTVYWRRSQSQFEDFGLIGV